MLLSDSFLEVRDDLNMNKKQLCRSLPLCAKSCRRCTVSKFMTHMLSYAAPKADITNRSWHSFHVSPIKSSEPSSSAFLEATTNLSELTGLIKTYFLASP